MRRSVETAASVPRRPASLALALPRSGVAFGVAAIVGASVVVRSLAAWHKSTPAYFPDEYLYAELARSLGETGSPLVRGADAGFPALLQPVLTAPFWLVGDTALSYHLVQVFGVLVMSLVALPVYFLARRLDLGAGVALGCAAFSLAVPDFLYASRILAEPIAYPIALAAVAAGTLALARGGTRRQLLFLVLVALAILARVQFFVLPLAYVVAVAAIAVRERAPTRIVRDQALPLSVFALGVAAAATRPGAVGQHGSFLDVDLGVGPTERLATNAFGLAYAGGWLLIPGAVLGLVLALARPRSREELAFGAFAGAFSLGLLGEAATYGDVDRIQERDFFYALPLLALLFGLYASRGWPHRRALALISLAPLVVVAVLPLTFATAAEEKTQAAFLLAAFRLEQALGGPGVGALALAAASSVLVLGALACSFRPRSGAVIVLGLGTAFCALGSLGAAAYDLEGTARVRDRYLPAERAWVVDRGVENAALVRLFRVSGDTYQQLFWNRSLDSLLLLRDVPVSDAYRIERVSIARDGTLVSDGRPVVRPLVIDEYGGRVELDAAVPIASAPTHRLWRPTGTPRLRFVAEGYYGKASLGRSGAFRIWPSSPSGELSGRIAFRAKPDFRTTLTIRGPHARSVYRLVPRRATAISIAVCSRGPWIATFEATESAWDGARFVSTGATTPRWIENPGACARRGRP